MGGDSSGGATSSGGTGGVGTGGNDPGPDCILRVDASVRAAIADGETWASAFAHPKDALAHMADEALSECDLWIAEGTYAIDAAGLTVESARLFGGFDGDETSFAERNPEANAVLFDGERAPTNVLSLTDVTLDSIGVTGGERGVRVVSGAVSLEGVDVFDNAPLGGLLVEDGSLALVRSRVFQNTATDTSGGGGLLAQAGTNVSVEDSVFANNTTTGTSGGRQGGAAQLLGATMDIKRTLFVGNRSVTGGGALSFQASGWRVEDSVFVGNVAPSGSGLLAGVPGEVVNATFFENSGDTTVNGVCTVLNSILWQNEANLPSGSGEPNVLVSFVEGGYSGGSSQDVITTDPLLEGERFTATSASINAQSRSSLLGHDGTVPQGALEGFFAEVQTGGAAGFYWIVDNPTGSLELLGSWGSDLSAQTLAVFDLHLTAASPAIDRGRGTTPQHDVSDSDVEGNPRRDVGSVVDQGVGEPTYVDVGAYER